jgi:NADPH:quinone reductase-like Zn-dependent oxidoreductase
VRPGSQKQTALIPGSDASGAVVSIGSRVTRFKVGDHVLSLFRQGHLSRSLDATSLATGPGGQIDGVLRTYAVFPESGLVACPSNLSFEKAATLPCAATTAWNALYGLEDRSLKPGDWVLT